MYIKRILLENIGPILELDYQFPFDGEGRPKPVVLVGINGSGKSIFLSHIVNALLSAQQVIFDNSEVEKGKVYKYRSPNYISAGEHYYFAKLEFESGIETIEWQLSMTRDEFEKQFQYTPIHRDWTRIPQEHTSVFWTNMPEKTKEVEALLNKNSLLYFPPNRFEEPGWLNYDNLIARAEFSNIKHIKGFSNRNIIHYAPLERNRDWLLDVLFDRQTFELKTQQFSVQAQQGQTIPVNLFAGYIGVSSKRAEIH